MTNSTASPPSLGRTDWQTLFQEAVRDVGSQYELARRMADALDTDAENYKKAIRGFISGKRRPQNATQAWLIGEGLRAGGVSWASGPVALFAARHFSELIDFVAAVAELDRLRAAALGLAILQSFDFQAPLRDKAMENIVLKREARGDARRLFDVYNLRRFKLCWDPAIYGSAWRAVRDGRRRLTGHQIHLEVAKTYSAAKELPVLGRDAAVADSIVRWIEMIAPDLLAKAERKLVESFAHQRGHAELHRLSRLSPIYPELAENLAGFYAAQAKLIRRRRS